MALTRDRFHQLIRHPNTLTLFRVAASPLIVVLLMVPNRLTAFLAAMVFSVSAITDWLDGYLARRYGLESQLGRLLDPLADKVLMSSSFIMLAALGWVPAWMICVIVARELLVTGLRSIIAERQLDVSASVLGKWKTGFQIGAIIPLMLHYRYLGIDFHATGGIVLWGALVLTVWSGVDYFVRFRKLYIQ